MGVLLTCYVDTGMTFVEISLVMHFLNVPGYPSLQLKRHQQQKGNHTAQDAIREEQIVLLKKKSVASSS
jgi:hypothetical protein